MSLSAIVLMCVILLVVWGGFALSLRMAVKKESKKH